jgi:hypothetical protein
LIIAMHTMGANPQPHLSILSLRGLKHSNEVADDYFLQQEEERLHNYPLFGEYSSRYISEVLDFTNKILFSRLALYCT